MAGGLLGVRPSAAQVALSAHGSAWRSGSAVAALFVGCGASSAPLASAVPTHRIVPPSVQHDAMHAPLHGLLDPRTSIHVTGWIISGQGDGSFVLSADANSARLALAPAESFALPPPDEPLRVPPRWVEALVADVAPPLLGVACRASSKLAAVRRQSWTLSSDGITTHYVDHCRVAGVSTESLQSLADDFEQRVLHVVAASRRIEAVRRYGAGQPIPNAPWSLSTNAGGHIELTHRTVRSVVGGFELCNYYYQSETPPLCFAVPDVVAAALAHIAYSGGCAEEVISVTCATNEEVIHALDLASDWRSDFDPFAVAVEELE